MAQSAFRHNLILAAIIAAAAAVLFLWVCPWLAIFGHERLCIALYALLMIIYVFGRADVVRPKKRPPEQGTQDGDRIAS
jgi:hypothetical protein